MGMLKRTITCSFLLFVSVANSLGNSDLHSDDVLDNADLVQGRLYTADAAASAAAPAAAIGNNSSNATMEPTPAPTPFPPLYRLVFTRTWGDDHVCMTELEFYDQVNNSLRGTFDSATSCWGCAVSCANCTVDYGNPLVLFDGDSTTDNARAYFCTDFGSFNGTGALGSETITFELPRRPHHFSLARPDTQGLAIPRDWRLEERQPDDTWEVIGKTVDKAASTNQTVLVTSDSGPAGRWWEFETQKCMANMDLPGSSNLRLDYTYLDVKAGGFENNGHGIYVDGYLGAIQVDGEYYYAKQMHFAFPSSRMTGTGEDQTELTGEIHITHQKPDGKGTSHTHQDGILIVVVPLKLPVEGSEKVTKTQEWFTQMALTKLPNMGDVQAFPITFNLNAFAVQLNGTYQELPCRANSTLGIDDKSPRWFLLDEVAYIPGKVVQGFMNGQFQFADFNKTFLINGKLQQVAYDSLGREHLLAISQGFDDNTVPTMAVPGQHWQPNPGFVAGCSEFLPYGEWYIPANTSEPSPAPTPPPTPLPPPANPSLR